jgi:hypothetical protein
MHMPPGVSPYERLSQRVVNGQLVVGGLAVVAVAPEAEEPLACSQMSWVGWTLYQAQQDKWRPGGALIAMVLALTQEVQLAMLVRNGTSGLTAAKGFRTL